MLDIKFIRQHLDLVKQAAVKKKITVDLDRLIAVDELRISLSQQIDTKRAEQNEASNLIASTTDQAVRAEKIEAMKAVKESLQKLEEDLKPVTEEWQSLMYKVPNIPDITVPEGAGEEENVTTKEWGTKPVFDFEPKDHIDIMKALDMVDFERGTKVHGFRGYFLKNMGAQLSWAIWNYARDFFGARNFVHMIAPAVVHHEFFYGTGHLPNDAEDLYNTQDGDHLSGTAEVPMMAYHSDEILDQQELPLKYLAFSPCFRREAGSHSRDVKGLIRVNEFYKLEQLIICEGTHQESDRWFEEVNKNHEEFIESLGIPYRRLTICTGDLSASKVKQYDTELWVPMENTYREISSASYFHDYQTRRFNIRYRDREGAIHFTHSLNCTAIPTPRILVSLIENFQQADGSVKIPEVLQKYLGGVEKIG